MSTLTGRSGRVYTEKQGIHKRTSDGNYTITKATSENDTYVLKQVPWQVYERSQRIATDLAESRRLRLHVDCNDEHKILVHPYMRENLLTLVTRSVQPELDFHSRRKILREVGEAIRELHHSGWVHNDLKPDNILVNWTNDDRNHKIITDVILGDFDISLKQGDADPRHEQYAVGNVMWRSPEGQIGRRGTTMSDVYSFGLVFIFVLGGADLLIIDDAQELARLDIIPEQYIVNRHFAYFGPVPQSFIDGLADETWRQRFRQSADAAERMAAERPEMRLSYWGQDLGPEALQLVAAMTSLEPATRPSIDEIMAHEWWTIDD
ncbi:kinase-like domain-containing protein [Elsinoe ampelina]|uniref:Kinase-like domain-containing protein n=1 Tax=Elsinoe ampelina TaxID=302913 RepID=A0A6A6G3J3_9PEZI|nr:kinase-like domain-containing protein [Elsinoe ampelina]